MIEQIVNSIRIHRERERERNVIYCLAIGRTDVIFDNERKTFWIELRRENAAGPIYDGLPNEGNDESIGRDTRLGGILIQNYEGEHHFEVHDRHHIVYPHTVQIFNRATYKPSIYAHELATDIIIKISGDTKTYSYRNLVEFLAKLESSQRQITETQERLQAAEQEGQQARAEELRVELEKEQEEQKALLAKTQNFIRQNAELRWQPILDKEQDAIKRMKIFDGGTLIINGGPGTGKTTSLIQRIKFLTSNTIEEYKSLDKKQWEVLFNQEGTSWIFFSPTELLKLFLRESMAKEELPAFEGTVKVWSEYKWGIIRLYEWPDGDNPIFRRNKQPESLFTDAKGIREIISKFKEFYLNRQREILQKRLDRFESQRDEKHTTKSDLQNKVQTDNIRKQISELEQQEEILADIISSIKKYISSSNFEIEELIRVYVGIEVKYSNFSHINDEENDRREQSAFNKAVNKILNIIPGTYKKFRRQQFDNDDTNWNQDLLIDLLDRNALGRQNHDIHSDEQSFLIYIINTICYYIYQKYHLFFPESNSTYIRTYRAHCKPVIAIDEATDFSLIDILAMHSFRHPEISSVTLSGDIMQRMTPFGLHSWEDFSSYLKPQAQIENLTISYRQSPTLLKLAQKIYRYSTNKEAEYTSYMEYDPSESKPLMKIAESEVDKITWLATRIKEINTIYIRSTGALPSVAVFVPSEDDIKAFVHELDNRLNGAIPVKGCYNGDVLGTSSHVRVYAIDKIKGLEFEAVLFHNLDKLAALDANIMLKYLYVGLSRATFYLGVTLSRDMDNRLDFIQAEFSQDGNWQLPDAAAIDRDAENED